MKRWRLLLVIGIMALSLGACANEDISLEKENILEETQETVEDTFPELTAPEIDLPSSEQSSEPSGAIPEKELFVDEESSPVEPIDFSAFLEEVSLQRQNLFEAAENFDGFENYLVNDVSLTNLLTKQEIQSLLQTGARLETISYEQAVYDVDILFRAFRSAYGAYYYFGEDVFDNAKMDIMQWLEGTSEVSCVDFEKKLGDVFSFLRDAHACVGPRGDEKDVRWVYFYCTGQEYGKDDIGYYKYNGTEKWYVQSFSNDYVKMAPSLTEDGKLVYAPVLFCPMFTPQQCEVRLKNTQGEYATLNLSWKQSEAFNGSSMTPDFRLLEESGVAYLSVRNFNDKYSDELEEFVESGATVKDAELIIFDIRSNGGGSDRFARGWVEKFANESPSCPRVVGVRHSSLRDAVSNRDGYSPHKQEYGTFEYMVSQGARLNNQVPIIVLVDDRCGSAGESMLNYLRSLENVLVVGSNSSGFQMCGNVMAFSLPNSNIEFCFGNALQFWFSDENVDYKGYEPDVWCNPQVAVEAVLKMIENYEITEKEAVHAICQAMDGVILNPEVITLEWNAILHQAGWDLRGEVGEYEIPVLVNQVRTEEFTVESSNTDVCICTKGKEGNIVLTSVGVGESWITVTTQRTSAQFLWVTEGGT